MDYAAGANWMRLRLPVPRSASAPIARLPSALMERQFRHLSPWPMFYALQYFTRLTVRPALGSLVLHGSEYWTQHPLVPAILTEHFAARAALGDTPGFGSRAAGPVASRPRGRQRAAPPDRPSLGARAPGGARRLAPETLDREFLQTFGRFVERAPKPELLVEHDAIKEQLARAEAFVLNEPFRSVLVVGEPRAGKTSFLMLLAARAAAKAGRCSRPARRT